MGKHTELGRNGEIRAVDFLVNKGHMIITTNYRTAHQEIDIISLDKDVLVFSEIKTRSHYRFGFPEEAVTAKKQEHIKSAAAQYLLENPEFLKIRFDIISILMQNDKPIEIVHFEDAFY